MYPTWKIFQKICMPEMLLRVQNWGKMAYLSPTKRTYLGNFICTNFVCNDSPLSKTISSFNPWSRSETSLYPPLHLQESYLKANNEAWFILTMNKNNSEDTFVSLSWNTCKRTLTLQSLNVPKLLVHISDMLTADSNCSCLHCLYIFSVFKSFTAFFKTRQFSNH